MMSGRLPDRWAISGAPIGVAAGGGGQRGCRFGQRRRRQPERIGTGDEGGLVRGDEAQNLGEKRRLSGARTQIGRHEAGQREEALRAFILGEHPAERRQRERQRVWRGRVRVTENCWPRYCQSIVRFWRGAYRRCMAKRILVVEDNDLNRKLFCDVLKAHGYVIEPVADGRDALERARAFVPSLIIMDIELPNVSGLALIEAAKADPLLRQVPVLAVTAYAGKGDEERIREAGAEGYLAKPVSIGPFMAAVKGFVSE